MTKYRLATTAAVLSMALISSGAEAGSRHQVVYQPSILSQFFRLSPVYESGKIVRQGIRHGYRVAHHSFSMLHGVYAPLASKAQEIVSACGSTVISGVRHTFVEGTHSLSEHATGHAVDVRGNPACIYSHLSGWPGGYSTDYSTMQHVHISLGGREDGLRFVHHHSRQHHRHHHRR